MTRTINYRGTSSNEARSDVKKAITDLDNSKYSGHVEWSSDGSVQVGIALPDVAVSDVEEEINAMDTFVAGLDVSLPTAAENAQVRGQGNAP